MASVLLRNEEALAWTEEEKGGFDERYIPPLKIPVVDHTPWQDRNIRLPVKTREKVIEFLKQKIASGLYERSQSAYRSGFFAVEKKDGRIRLVHDLQRLNSITIRDAGVPPLMDSLTEDLAGCHIYTGLDAFSGYDQVGIDVKSRDLTTFQSPLGTLRLRRLPQGWTNAVAAFQRVMVFIFQDENLTKVQVYIDDVAVLGPREQYLDKDGKPELAHPGIRRFVLEHLNWLNVVLHKMKRLGGTFSGGKIQLAVPALEVVGYICSAQGRQITKRATTKIQNWPPCQSVKAVRGFLGVVGIARNWIKGYGAMSRPLVELTRKTMREFLWTALHDQAMAQIKEAVLNSGFIRPIVYGRIDDYPPIVAIDSSQQGCGVELAQMGVDGKRYPARFLSLYFNEVQQRYSQPKLELYGVFVGLRAVRHYIHSTRFILEVDCTSIKQMINNPVIPNGSEGRWCWYIKMNDFILEHVPADKHKVPDGLSRRERSSADTQSDTDPEDWLDHYCGEVALHQRHCPGLYQVGRGPPRLLPPPAAGTFYQAGRGAKQVVTHALTLLSDDTEETEDPSAEDGPVDDFDEARYKDSEKWRRVGLFLAKREGAASGKKFKTQAIRQWARYCWLEDGFIMRQKPGQMPKRVIGNSEDRWEILTRLHEEHGHRGVKATYAKTSDRFYWDGMVKTVKSWVKTCPDCQARDYKHYENVRESIAVPTIFGRMSLDCVHMPENQTWGPHPRDHVPDKYIILIRDDLSGWVEGRAVNKLSAENAAKVFFEDVVCRFGLIGQVTTDNGSEFMGAFRECLVRYGIKHILTSSYHPEANGMVERGHGPLKEALFKLMRTRGPNWVNLLPFALWADRTTAKRTTRHTPHYMLYGQESILPIDADYHTYLTGNWKSTMTTSELLVTRIRQLERLPEDVKVARRLAQEERDRSVLNHNACLEHYQSGRGFEEGHLVLVRNSKQDQSHAVKQEDRFLGPYKISDLGPNGSVYLEELDGTPIADKGLTQVGHNRLRRFFPRVRFDIEENPAADERPYQAERHRNARKRRGDKQHRPQMVSAGVAPRDRVLEERVMLSTDVHRSQAPNPTNDSSQPVRDSGSFLPSSD